jgi:hypothetical protein
VVVDGDMDELSADAGDLVAIVARDPVRGPRDANQALDVQVQKIAGKRML